jgi:hypothetical protein
LHQLIHQDINVHAQYTMASKKDDKMIAYDRDDNGLALETTYSSEDEVIENSNPEQTPMLNGQQLEFEQDGFPWRDINIRRANGSNAYFADVSRFSRNVPDIQLRANGREGPTVAAAYFNISSSIKCGLGSNEQSMEWFDMKRTGVLGYQKYAFEYRGKKYTLHRSKDPGNGISGAQRFLASHYQVVEEQSGSILASYNGTVGIGKRKGTLAFAGDVSPQLEALIVVSVAAWREKARRRHTAAASGGVAAGT